MGTPGERKALLFFGAVLAIGGAVRAAKAVSRRDRIPATAKAAIERQISAVDSVRKQGRKKKPKRPPKAEPETPAIIDLDLASAEQIETIRGIGPSLARRIVADRDSLGPFGSLEELQRVKGVGPKLAARIDSSVTFSLLPRPSTTAITRSGAAKRRRKPPRGDPQN
jgi:competence ComEA-like helix-hairpin-helix protein